MTGLALIAPFMALCLFALGSIALTLRNALPAIRRLRAELAAGSSRMEYTFRITEVTMAQAAAGYETSGRETNIVALPVRQPRHRQGAAGWRAAA